ncbi:MAG: PadR family transcriptional regulator [Leptolyngbyaceae bacterium]|nr:PadR family transcriptional regulator [Leptolyngbyaceae bacterium]
MFELAALGLLQGEPLHGYRLKQQLELFMSGCISVNYGTIYPLLKRLEKQGAISVLVEEEGEAGASRKIYSITDLGRQIWKQKMLEHPRESWVNARSRFMIKLFFFSHLEPSDRLKLLEHRLMVCRLRLEEQEALPVLTEPYQSLAWERCQSVLHDEIHWLNEQLAEARASLPLETSK